MLVWAPHESTLAVASAGGVWLYDPTAHSEPAMLPASAADITSVAFGPDGARLAAGTRSGSITLWDLSSPGSPRTLSDHEAPVSSLAFHPTGHTLASGGGRNRPGVAVTPAEGFEDTAVRLWNVASGELLTRLLHDHGMVYGLAFSPDGQVLSAEASDTLSGRSVGEGAIVRWRPETRQALPTLPAGGAITFDPAGATALTMNHASVPERIWDLTTGDERGRISGVGHWAYDLTLRYDAGIVAAALGEFGLGNTWTWAWTADGTALAMLPAGAPIALGPDGQWLASGNGPTAHCGSEFRYEPIDHLVRLYPVAGGEPVAVLDTGGLETVDVAFSSDGQWLAAISLDGVVRLWQAATWSGTPAASDSTP